MIGYLLFYGVILGPALYFWLDEHGFINRPVKKVREIDSFVSTKAVNRITVDKPKVIPVDVKANIPPVPSSSVSVVPAWYCMSGIDPSPAEQIIIDHLKFYPDVIWHREVCFERFNTPKGYPYRFDFYIPSLNIIIEYDGSKWHNTVNSMEIDGLKTKFCADHSIRMVRYNKQHYYQLGTHIDALLYECGVSLV